MTYLPNRGAALGRCLRLFAGAVALAMTMAAEPAVAGEAAAAPAPVFQGFLEPVFDGPTPQCLAADADLQERLRPLLDQAVQISLTLGDIQAAMRKARALCEEGHADRGTMLYIRISDAVANALAISGRRAAR